LLIDPGPCGSGLVSPDAAARCNGWGSRERDAPLSRWDQSGGYDTATACETDIRIRTQLLKRHAADETRADWYRQQQRVLHERYLHALCVAADDPRLNQ